MIEMFWVEDFLSGKVLENKYYSTREEAAARRNELGYGIVKWVELAGHDRVGHENQGTAHDPGAHGHELQGRDTE